MKEEKSEDIFNHSPRPAHIIRVVSRGVGAVVLHRVFVRHRRELGDLDVVRIHEGDHGVAGDDRGREDEPAVHVDDLDADRGAGLRGELQPAVLGAVPGTVIHEDHEARLIVLVETAGEVGDDPLVAGGDGAVVLGGFVLVAAAGAGRVGTFRLDADVLFGRGRCCRAGGGAVADGDGGGNAGEGEEDEHGDLRGGETNR